jgi:DNA-binding response OmpR family regulator
VIGSRRILVVDDDPASCELVAYSLKPLGYRVAIAADGDRALNMGMEDDFGLVILDVHMPMHDGIEILAKIRERHRRVPVKMLALTGDESDEVRSAMAARGIDGFLTKPVDLEALRGEVTRLMVGQLSGDLRLYRRLLDRQRRPRHTHSTHI